MHAFCDLFSLENLSNKSKHIIYFLYVLICLVFIIYSIMISSSRSALLGSVAGTAFFFLLLFVKSTSIFNKNNFTLIFITISTFLFGLVGISLFTDIDKSILFKEERINTFYVDQLNEASIKNMVKEMKIEKEEVFGPVLAIIRTNEIDKAIKIENDSNYGNASSVYTQDGKLANYITEKVSAGMVGVNIGVPVPREPFSFGGWNESRFGVGDITGKSSINFWTRLKKRTSKWNASAKKNWMS